MGLWDVASVTIACGPEGALVVDAQGSVLPARLVDQVQSVHVGQALRVLLPNVQDGRVLWGCVAGIDEPRDASRAPLAAGMRFRMSVLRLTGLDEDRPALPAPFDATEDSSPAGVLGNLRNMPLSDILQMLENGQRTAAVEIHPRAGGEYGTLLIHDGHVVDARWMALGGLDAALALLGVEKGTFWIRYVREECTGSPLDLSISWILMEAMRQQDGQAAAPACEGRSLWHFASLEVAGVLKGEDPWRRNSSTRDAVFPWSDSGSFPRG